MNTKQLAPSRRKVTLSNKDGNQTKLISNSVPATNKAATPNINTTTKSKTSKESLSSPT